MLPKDFEVAKNLQMTEELQSILLFNVSQLYSSLLPSNQSKQDYTQNLAELYVSINMLALKLGVTNDVINQKAKSIIKLNLVNEERSQWKNAYLEILNDF